MVIAKIVREIRLLAYRVNIRRYTMYIFDEDSFLQYFISIHYYLNYPNFLSRGNVQYINNNVKRCVHIYIHTIGTMRLHFVLVY